MTPRGAKVGHWRTRRGAAPGASSPLVTRHGERLARREHRLLRAWPRTTVAFGGSASVFFDHRRAARTRDAPTLASPRSRARVDGVARARAHRNDRETHRTTRSRMRAKWERCSGKLGWTGRVMIVIANARDAPRALEPSTQTHRHRRHHGRSRRSGGFFRCAVSAERFGSTVIRFLSSQFRPWPTRWRRGGRTGAVWSLAATRRSATGA